MEIQPPILLSPTGFMSAAPNATIDSAASAAPTELSTGFRQLMTALCGLTAIVGLTASVYAFLTIVASKELRKSPFYLLLAGLAGVSGLFCASLIYTAANFVLLRGTENFDCSVFAGATLYSSCSYVWISAAIALNRYSVIVQNSWPRFQVFATVRGALASVAAVCVGCLAILAPPAAQLGQLGYESRGQICLLSSHASGSRAYFWLLSVMYYIPIMVMMKYYYCIIAEIRRNIASARSLSRTVSGSVPLARVKRLGKMLRSAVHCAVLPAVVFCCLLPTSIDLAIAMYSHRESTRSHNYWSPLLRLLAFVGAGLTGLLILTTGDDLRSIALRAFRRFLCPPPPTVVRHTMRANIHRRPRQFVVAESKRGMWRPSGLVYR